MTILIFTYLFQKQLVFSQINFLITISMHIAFLCLHLLLFLLFIFLLYVAYKITIKAYNCILNDIKEDEYFKWIYILLFIYIILIKIFTVSISNIFDLSKFSVCMVVLILFFRLTTMYIFNPLRNKKHSYSSIILYPIILFLEFLELFNINYISDTVLSVDTFREKNLILFDGTTGFMHIHDGISLIIENHPYLKGDKSSQDFDYEIRKSLNSGTTIYNTNFRVYNRVQGKLPLEVIRNIEFPFTDFFHQESIKTRRVCSWYYCQLYRKIKENYPLEVLRHDYTLVSDYSQGFDPSINDQHWLIMGDPNIEMGIIAQSRLLICIGELKDESKRVQPHINSPTMKDLIDLYSSRHDPRETYKFTLQCQQYLYKENLVERSLLNKTGGILWSKISPTNLTSKLFALSRR